MKKACLLMVLSMVALSFGNALAASSIEGTVTYAGSKTGQVYVAYYEGPCGGGNVFSGVVEGPFGSPPYAYKLEDLDDGEYCVGAFLDVTGAGYPPDFSAPVGVYGDTVTVPPSKTGIDIALSDPGSMTGIWDGTAEVTFTLPNESARAAENCTYVGIAYLYQFQDFVIGPADLTRTSGSENCPDPLEMFVTFEKSGSALDGKIAFDEDNIYPATGELTNGEKTASGNFSGEYRGALFEASWVLIKRVEAPAIPSVTPWGALALALLVAGSSLWMLRRKKGSKRG